IVTAVDALRRDGLVDEVLVVDDGSSDTTADRARAAGATVLAGPGGPGKGEALARAVAATAAELLVFLDADVVRFSARFVTDLLAPLLRDPAVQLVKPAYRRPLDGRPGEGGRVTEILARPLLRRFFPELAGVAQPLAGESALRRSALTGGIALAGGYGVEIALLIDVYRRHGRAAVAEVDLGERAHRNRPLHQLRPHSDDVLAAVLARATHLA
ncbi:MAG TPA: glycosyltransferase, partial [Acidimicrobiales bacterium]|nr:glycosyltransferase [Acidimicrobiales bacterium]